MSATLKLFTSGLKLAAASLMVQAMIGLCQSPQAPLTTLTYRVLGTQLRVTPAAVSVPKSIPGSVLVEVANADGSTNAATAQLAAGAYVEATLRGPSFDARRLVGQPNAPLMLPPLNLVGDYQLDDIKLVDATTGAVRMEGNPSSVPVHVFEEVLISKVTSRPLTTEEINEKGIYIDEQNFRAVEFEVGFVLDGKTIPVKFPVVAPTFKQSTEIIPAAELEQKLIQAQLINSQIATGVELPKELQTAQLNLDVQGINFQFVEDKEVDLGLRIPPIPALMVIPGNIGYLNQFFSVQIFTENGAPLNSGLNVHEVMARLVLPPGPDQIASTNYAQPGDDPLRFARVGPNKIIQPTQQIVRAGVDGQIGTADDIPRLYPSESGQAEFLVEGLQEGLHVMNVELSANLDGLAAGTVKIAGKAAGSVLVRNPKFSMAFTHPRTIRAGEPYQATVTILNTSSSIANLVSVTLARNSISGGVLESDPTIQLGTIMPGQSATATFRVRAQRTGAISFSNLTTGEDSVQGRFHLTMGIDERGVILSPDTIAMPGYVTNLPPALVDAANRVLGQALSAATAPLLPPNVKRVTKGVITKRVLEMAEAGQRILYGDPMSRVLADLMLDWQGARNFDAGFDQILGSTDAGHEWRNALAVVLEVADGKDATSRWVDRAADIAGRSESWVLGSMSVAAGSMVYTTDAGQADLESSTLTQSLVYGASNGCWLAGMPGTDGVVRWLFTNTVSNTELGVWVFGTNGTAHQLRWTLNEVPAGACYQFGFSGVSSDLLADTNCDGTIDALVAGTSTSVQERPPELIAVLQDREPYVGRPNPHCLSQVANNYGTVLAVLFSKPMTQATVNVPSAYQFENGNVGASVQIQPGGRVALVNMRMPFSALKPRTLSVVGVQDLRGHPLQANGLQIVSDLRQGVAVRGRVVKADGSPAAGVPVTLTMYDQMYSGLMECQPYTVRAAQTITDESGNFVFDFVLAGVPYSVSATDTSGLSPEAIQVIMAASSAGAADRQRLQDLADSESVRNTLLQAFAVGALPEAIVRAEGLDRAVLWDSVDEGSARQGTETVVALRFRGRATVTGQILAADGVTPVYQAAVNLFPDPDSRELGRGMYSDVNGRFAFYGVPLGRFSVDATSPVGQGRT
ncbi:MAG TPA: carboxypeptidase-like regulatory domain-containing protein, partial [Clostridia bacterium]|nr:carboxypeptidase-like regulatory domain-containing protein [Clostridia bacterium]